MHPTWQGSTRTSVARKLQNTVKFSSKIKLWACTTPNPLIINSKRIRGQNRTDVANPLEHSENETSGLVFWKFEEFWNFRNSPSETFQKYSRHHRNLFSTSNRTIWLNNAHAFIHPERKSRKSMNFWKLVRNSRVAQNIRLLHQINSNNLTKRSRSV